VAQFIGNANRKVDPLPPPLRESASPLRYGLPRDKEIWGDDAGRASEPPSEHRLCLVLSEVPAVLSKPAAARPEGPPPHVLGRLMLAAARLMSALRWAVMGTPLGRYAGGGGMRIPGGL